MKSSELRLGAWGITGISFISTLCTLVVYFVTSGEEKFFSYPFYQQILLFLYQTQDNILYSIFRIPGILFLGGLLAYWILYFVVLLPIKMIGLAARKKRKQKRIKFLDMKSFKAPGIAMFLKWIAVLAYFLAYYYFFAYYLNDVAYPRDIWIHYVIFYMYGILGAIFVNHLFNLISPCKSNRYFELGFMLLLAGGCVAAYFFLDRLGISLNYYIHGCIFLSLVAILNASDCTSLDAEICPGCKSRCVSILKNKKYNDLGTSIGFEDRTRKVGTRETSITITDDRGNTIAEGTGSEDIYEDYIGTYETEESETVYTYDNECIHCHRHHETGETVHHSKRIW